jgi:rod shape-determining protein MreC
VVTAGGVVGQVIRVTGGYADVMTVKDATSRTAVRVQRSRARATASGAGGDRNLLLENLLRTEDVQEGDLIVTAGTDGVFPPGLPVGKATAVDRRASGMFQSAEVVPAVDMTRVEEVLVLPPVEPVANPATVQVPARREATP